MRIDSDWDDRASLKIPRASIYCRGATAEVFRYQATCWRQMVEIAHHKVGATHKG